MRTRLPAAALAALACLPGLAAPSRAQSGEAAAVPLRAEIAVDGAAAEIAGRLFAAPGSRLRPRLGGNAEAVARWDPSLDGSPAGYLPATWPAGEHTVGGTAFDLSGAGFEVAPLAFTVDAEPPAVRWEVRDPGIFDTRGEPRKARRSRATRR